MEHSVAMPSSHVDSLRQIEDGYWWFAARVNWALRLLDSISLPAHCRYADLGCGTGGFAHHIASHFKPESVALVDGDPAVLKLASHYPNYSVHEQDFAEELHLPWTPNLISCMDVLEHLPDDRTFLEQTYRTLPAGGIFLCSVPAFPFLFSEWDRRLGHFRRYTAGSLRQLLESSGFEILHSHYMWSFLFPAAPIRKLRTKRYRQNMEFEPTGPFFNKLLITLSDWEWKANQLVRPPWGTSLIVLARKP